MKIFRQQGDLKTELRGNIKRGKVGFVPTMGALHKGHLSLIEKAKETCEIVVCSIFVNPTQFDQTSDFEKYPITIDQDIALLESVDCDVLFLPDSADEVYKNETSFELDLSPLDKVLEGAHRKGHFEGVVRVVKLLFEIVEPDQAFFGLKDYQQYLIIKKMVKELSLSVEIIGCDIIREEDGLAMSSRNLRLNDEQRKDALVLKKALDFARDNFGQMEITSLHSHCLDLLKKKSIPEYFELCEANSLKSINTSQSIDHSIHIRAFVAAMVGNIRLIDNIQIC